MGYDRVRRGDLLLKPSPFVAAVVRTHRLGRRCLATVLSMNAYVVARYPDSRSPQATALEARAFQSKHVQDCDRRGWVQTEGLIARPPATAAEPIASMLGLGTLKAEVAGRLGLTQDEVKNSGSC